jgi:beta-lactamase regulating signal transducer with metallopeptidase domain
MAIGIVRHAIVLPADADAWSNERRRAVLLRELAHVARRDCLTQLAAVVTCIVYWIHPMVWWVARRMRIEREFACDDRVVAAGIGAHDYGQHLLDLARSGGGGAGECRRWRWPCMM